MQTSRLLFFEQIMDQLKGDIAVFDLHHRYVYVNPYAVKDPEMRKWIIGKKDEEYCSCRGIDPSLANRRRSYFEEALRTGLQQEWEELLPDREGRLRAYIRRVFVVCDAAGKPEFLVGHGIEITERWNAENELRNSRELLANVLQASPGPVAVKDNEGRLLLVNKAMAERYRSDEVALVGRFQHELKGASDDVDSFERLEKGLVSNGMQDRREEQFTGPDGTVSWFETVRIPFRNANGDSQLLVFSTDITERRKKEILLIESQDKLNEAQEMSKTGSFELSFQDGKLSWSRGMYLIWEIDPSVQPSIELFYRHLHPDDRAMVLERQQAIKPDQPPWSITYRIITPTGGQKYVEAYTKVEKTDGTASMRIIGTCQDVTERKVFEQRVQASELRLLEAQEIARSGSWEIRTQPELSIEWSPGLFKICQRDPSLGTPRPEEFYDRMSEPERGLMQQTIEDLLQGGTPSEVRYGFLTWKGEQRMFVSRGLSLKDSSGQVISIYGTTTDITSEFEAEERLRSSERQLLMAQDIARVGSFVFNIETMQVEWSPGMYTIWELDPVHGTPSFDYLLTTYHPEDVPMVSRMTGLPSNDAVEKSMELRIIMPDQRIKQIEVRYRRLEENGKVMNKVFGTAMDVTAKKESEQELVRARRQAEDSLKAKENFLANISHELRTPLNGILGMLRLLQKTNLNSIQREYIDVLSHTSGNLLTIINDILDFARLEAGGYALEESVFDPALVADTAFQLQLIKAEEKGLTMRHLHEGTEPMPRVIGDQHRLGQVLLNLLNNAVKFTNRGEVLLTHRLVSSEGDRVVLSFSVRDTGIGIPPGMTERIFESFTQVHASEFGGGGVGLGLTITKGLVERLGGKIRLESKPDVGSTFTVEIPYRKAAMEGVRSGDTTIPAALGELRVLVVEDNKVNLYITESMLQAWGMSVDVAMNGEEAVRMAEEYNYDLILMDIQMPVMDGLEATRRIRRFRNSTRASVPVVAVTANTSRLAQRKLIREGMNDCLVKPFREEQLFRKILSNINKDNLSARSLPKRKFPQRKTPVGKSKALYDLSLLMRDDPGNAVFLKRMLSIFIETIPASVDSMEEHFMNEEWEMVSTLAHKIKPTLDGTGIVSLRDTIRNIEGYLDKKRTPSQLGEDIATLRMTIDQVVRSFQKEIERIQS